MFFGARNLKLVVIVDLLEILIDLDLVFRFFFMSFEVIFF